MDTNQIAVLRKILKNIQQLDIGELLSSIFKDQDIDTVKIGQWSVAEYASTTKRLIKQFENELEENGLFLPFQYNYQNEFGGGNLQNDIQQLHNHLNAKHYQGLINSIDVIKRLIYYQITNGFWDKSTRKIHNANEIKITELNDQLNYIKKQLSDNFESFKNLLKGLNGEKKKLEDFIGQKNQELQQITNNLQTANVNTNQISGLLNNSTAMNEKINGLLNAQQKRAESQDAYFEKQKSTFNNLETMLGEKVKTVETQLEEFKGHLEFVEGKREFFEERNNYLSGLIGREVGASLFETFKQRKIELEKPVNKWLWIVVTMAILTFGAILAIFTSWFGYFGNAPTEISIPRLITNSIKTLPFFFLLFYSIAQYNKERNFQEEYAFKSAVALTIKAYSDIVKKEELKDELIVNSVSEVYKSPTIYKTKKSKEDSTMLDTAKDLLTTALEVLKKR